MTMMRSAMISILLVKNVHSASVIRKSNCVDFHVAPMQCYTNRPFRRLCSSLSPSSTFWTEMEKADDLMPHIQESLMQRLGDPSSETYSSYQKEKRLVLQLGSNDPFKVQECVKAAMVLDYNQLKEINLNCGCPAIDSGGALTYGASLMKDPALTASLVKACVENCKDDVDVSVKCRIGVVDHADELFLLESSSSSPAYYDYERLHQYVSQIQAAGANHLVLHARPAVLAGLSPVKNRIVPKLKFDMVRQVAKDFPNLKVTLNGGLHSLSQLIKEENINEESNISSFMAGRWILQRPLDLIAIEGWLLGNNQEQLGKRRIVTGSADNPGAFAIAKEAIEDYFDFCIIQSTSAPTTLATPPTSDLCLPLFLVVEQLREDFHDDDHKNEDQSATPAMLSFEQMESLYDLLQEGVSELNDCIKGGGNQKKKGSSSVNFKRLSTSFKSLVGTKVANKWKRNRAEL